MTMDKKQFFNMHAAKWHDMFYLDATTGKYDKFAAEFERLFEFVSMWQGATVIDAGCGAGILVPEITRRIMPGGTLYEVDYSDEMIRHNREHNAATGIHFLCENIRHCSLGDSVADIVICFSCFPHFEDKPSTLEKIALMLKPGGRLAVSHFASKDELNNHHAKHDSVKNDMLPENIEMVEMLENTGFSITDFIDESAFYYVGALKV